MGLPDEHQVEIEVPGAEKCPVHQDTFEKRVGTATRKAVKEIHKSGAKLLLVDSYTVEG